MPSLLKRFLCPLFVACLLITTRAAFGAQDRTPPTGASAGFYKVAGTIVSKTDGHPLERARVMLQDAKDSRKYEAIITQAGGKFDFENVPAGKYSLTGEKREYIPASYDQHDQYSTAIVTGAGLETENLVLKIAPTAVIWGRVLDEAGEPVRHASVALYYDDHQQGVHQIRRRSGGQTDDLGTYEMAHLAAGTYFLSVTATPWYAVHPPSNGAPQSKSPISRSLDVAYPVTYYADVSDSETATPIPVKGGDRLQVDIHLNPVPALRLTFKVPGDPQHGFVFPRLEQPDFDGSTFVQSGGGNFISPGVFEVTGVPAGQYNIRMQGQGTNVQMNGVDVTKDGEQIDTTTAEALGKLKVSIEIPGESSPPQAINVGLLGKGRNLAGSRVLDQKGEVEINDIPAGRYQFYLWGPRRPYAIARITAEGAEVSGKAIVLGAGASASANLTLIGGSVEISGVAKKADRGFAGAMVVLVPRDPENNRNLFRRDQSDLDGTFVLHNVVPGSYSLLAIEDGWDLDWSQPAVIAAYAKHGRPIELRDSAKVLELTEPLAVHSK